MAEGDEMFVIDALTIIPYFSYTQYNYLYNQRRFRFLLLMVLEYH